MFLNLLSPHNPEGNSCLHLTDGDTEAQVVKGPASQVHTFSHSQPDRHTSFCLGEGKPLAEAQGEAVSEMGPEYRSSESRRQALVTSHGPGRLWTADGDEPGLYGAWLCSSLAV